MNKKRGFLIGVVVFFAAVLVALLVLCVLLLTGVVHLPSSETNVSEPVTTSAAAVDSAVLETQISNTTSVPDVTETKPTVPQDTTAPTQTQPVETKDNVVVYIPDPPATTAPPQEDPVEQVIPLKFPYTIPGTSLTIQKIGGYSGIFLEDGSDGEVTDISAMMLVNNGSVGVELAEITVYCNGDPLTFKATAVPAGARIMVQELNATAYVSGATYTECSASVAIRDTFELSEDMVSLTETEDGALLVKNLTGETIPCVRVFYKFYMPSEDIYVGGIAYVAKIVDLQAGQSQTIIPSHYLSGSSKVVMVRTYDSAE